MQLDAYDTGSFFDEMFESCGRPRAACAQLLSRIESLADGELLRRQRAAESALLNLGITFNVYGDEGGTERIMPFDLVPRIVDSSDWAVVERGLVQRVHALNTFLADIYGSRKIVGDGVVPLEIIESARTMRPECAGLQPPNGVWCHISGIDLVRDERGRFLVLEDNLRTPSGVSYVLENRHVLKRTFPQVFEAAGVRAVDDYPSRLLDLLEQMAPLPIDNPVAVVLTPGPHNSAYFEHSYLAQQMGIELVEGRDLVVNGGFVHMRTTRGLERVDVIYRRIDDDFLDPKVFRADSALGVDGLMDVYRSGHVGLVNAPGTGIADDKVVYAYVPEIIRYYLGEEPILENVPTWVCAEDDQRAHVLAHLDELVVKSADGSGGYGMLIGPASTAAERSEFAMAIEADPRSYIAQPVVALSRAPVITGDHLEGRHVDLRPFVLNSGEDVYVLPGGLTRVAMRPGSLVVNSSQGGGSKDTWVLTR